MAFPESAWNRYRLAACTCGALFAVAALFSSTALAQTDLEKALQTPVDEALESPAPDRRAETPSDESIGETEQPAPDEEEDKLGGVAGLEAGLSRAQIEGKPALVFVTGDDCPWCRRLKAQMQRSPTREALARWTLVLVDVDQSPDAAARLGVGAIPALRILRTSGAKVAAHDGFMPGEQLVKWLNEHYRSAAAEADDALVSIDEPTTVSVVRLIQHLDDRDPLIREAAIGRLTTVPKLASGPLMDSLAQGNLATRLAVLEVLAQWDAPVEGVDPWRPETLSDEQLARLTDWQKELAESADAKPQAQAEAHLTEDQLAEASVQIDRLLQMSVADGAAIRARLARHAAALLPEVYRRLEAAETDDAREKLLALRYRLVAGDALVLRFPGGLGRLASRDAPVRRQAAAKLAALARADDQPLLLELFSDPDPLIREIALRGLQQVGGRAATASLVRLLEDPEPNVRAAVLKQLTEQASKSMVQQVAQYVKTEQDADLLVHAIRYFREAEGEQSARALLPLLEHEAWQVRAEAAEALNEVVDDLNDTHPALAADIYAGLIRRLSDEDAFVVSRAVDGLEQTVTEVAIEPLLIAAEKHPQLAPQIIAAVTRTEAPSKKVRERLGQFAQHKEPSIRAAAVAGLHAVSPNDVAQWGAAALRDKDQSVRLAAAEVFFRSFNSLRDEKHSSLTNAARGYDDVYRGGYSIPASRPSLLQRALQLFESSDDKNEAEAEPMVELAEPEEPEQPLAEDDRDPLNDAVEAKLPPKLGEAASGVKAAEPADAADDSQQKLPGVDAWDKWLTDFYAGKGRPKRYDDVLEPLREMLQAEDPQERLAAALVLIPMGRAEEALPALRASVKADKELIGRAAQALPWLVWEERREMFEELRTLAAGPKEKSQLVRAMVAAFDRRSAESLWPLLAEEGVDAEFASSLSDALLSAYHGERYYAAEAAEPVKAKVLADAQARIAEGNEWERLVALIQLAHIDHSAAAAAGKTIANDENAPASLREDAFQIALANSNPQERLSMALDELAKDNAQRQELSLHVLVLGADSLHYLREFAFYIPVASSSDYFSSDGGPIIPKPPAGVEAEHVRPLLKHDDPMTRALAGYVLALLGEQEGLDELLRYWRTDGQTPRGMEKLVYRAIAKQNAGEHLPILREIYSNLDDYYVGDFYWTIRIMSGEDLLLFRKEIRDKYGISNLR